MKNMYSSQLRADLRETERELAAAEKQLENPKKIDAEFMELYRKVNLIRIKRATLKSRIENLGKDGVIFPTIIPNF